jgi:hypothetical protein
MKRRRLRPRGSRRKRRKPRNGLRRRCNSCFARSMRAPSSQCTQGSAPKSGMALAALATAARGPRGRCIRLHVRCMHTSKRMCTCTHEHTVACFMLQVPCSTLMLHVPRCMLHIARSILHVPCTRRTLVVVARCVYLASCLRALKTRTLKVKETAERKKEQEEAVKKKAEEAAKKKAEEEAAKKKVEEAAAKRKAEEEEERAVKRKAEEKAARMKAEEEPARKKEEEKAAKKKEEDAVAKKKTEEEAAAQAKKEKGLDTAEKNEEEPAAAEKRAEKEAASEKIADGNHGIDGLAEAVARANLGGDVLTGAAAWIAAAGAHSVAQLEPDEIEGALSGRAAVTSDRTPVLDLMRALPGLCLFLCGASGSASRSTFWRAQSSSRASVCREFPRETSSAPSRRPRAYEPWTTAQYCGARCSS